MKILVTVGRALGSLCEDFGIALGDSGSTLGWLWDDFGRKVKNTFG